MHFHPYSLAEVTSAAVSRGHVLGVWSTLHRTLLACLPIDTLFTLQGLCQIALSHSISPQLGKHLQTLKTLF